MIMKFLTAFTVLMLTTLAGFGATYRYPVAMNTSNGVAFGRLTVNDHINATNSLRTNTFAGPIQQRGKATGSDSAAFGLNTYAGGLAFVTGLGNEGFGPGVLVGGVSNTVHTFGRYSLVGGAFNTASSPHNFAVGDHNLVNGVGSSAIGRNNQFDGDAHNSIAIGNAIQMLSGASNNVAISAGTNGLVVSGSDSFFVKANGGSFFSGGPITGDGSGLTNIPQSGLSGELWFTNTAESDSIFTPYSATIGGTFLATNVASSNRILGRLHIGKEEAFTNATGHLFEVLIANQNVTNPATRALSENVELVVSHTSENATLVHNSLYSLGAIGSANTADWTSSGYPQMNGIFGVIQPVSGSSGTIRRVSAVSATVGGAFPSGTGSILDEPVCFWGDFANGDTNMNYVVGYKQSGLQKGSNNTGIWLGILQTAYPQTGNWALWDETTYPSHFSGNIWGIGGTNGLTGKTAIGPVVGLNGSTNWLDVVAGTLTTNSKALNVTGTLASSASTETGVGITITGAGSEANQNHGVDITVSAGYTGSATSVGEQVINQSAGTGVLGWTASSANYGEFTAASGTTAGHNIGTMTRASSSSSLNMGSYSRAVSSLNSPALNIGSASVATLATVNVAGFFGLMNTDPAIVISAALVADNGATTDPIVIWRDNGSVVGGVIDDGAIYGNGLGITNIPQSGLSGALWFTNPAAASSISNAYNVSASTIAAVNTLSGQTLLATTETRSPIYRGATASSAFTLGTATTASISALSTGGVSITNTATANTALTLNGAASGATGQVIVYRTNNTDLFVLDASGNVGIGVAASERLTVSDTSAGVSLALRDTDAGLTARIRSIGSVGSQRGALELYDNNVLKTAIFSDSNDSYLNGAGDFGIGLTAPTNRLQVIGAIQSTTTVFSDIGYHTNGILWQGGAQLTNIYTATATLDFGNVATIGCADLTMTVTGAALGDVVDLGVPNASIVANSSYSAWVSAADTVTVRFCALISGDPASGVFRAEVHKWK